ncbi:ubiquitin family protein [Striga asiatica]|uniref:Ubiquitin family protein n=1 Tax=Striga asiatica TaxID=4170 RepID=A0A5A7QW09_STRAF|nr:ubiquitin family protein [Striga asiatica]
MQIFVRLMCGKRIKLEVESTDTIHSVKRKIESLERTRLCDHRLIFNGWCLEACKTLADYEIEKGCTIDVMLRYASSCVPYSDYSKLIEKVESLEGSLKLARERESHTAKLLEAESAAHSRLQSKVDLMAQMFDALLRPP